MRRKHVRLFASLMLLTIVSSASGFYTAGNAGRTGINAYGQLPLTFEPNEGQTDASVKFLSRSAGYTLFLTKSEAVLAFTDSDLTPLRMKVGGASANPDVAAYDELPGKVNFFIGKDATKWRTNIPTYKKVRYSDVYPGIDLVYYGNAKQLEYDFVVSPGADPALIRLDFDGNKTARIDGAGDLVLASGDRDIRMHKPIVYQEAHGKRHEVAAEYALLQDGQIGFAIGEYDKQATLIVDPVLMYSTYLGGNGADSAFGVAVDSSGSAYIAGRTASSDFPTATPIYPSNVVPDAFVTKLNAAGSGLVYSTYLGGAGFDEADSIVVDGSGNAYVTGTTLSGDFPTAGTPPPFQSTFGGSSDAFITKLNVSGSALVYSTFLGGSLDDSAKGIAIDSSNNVYVTGFTPSTNFPTLNSLQTFGGAYDAFVTKLNSTGSGLVYSTYLGGGDSDLGRGITVDTSGNAYVTGATASTNFPTTSPYQGSNAGGLNDGFVTKINAAGSARVFSTYIGGTNDDGGFSIAVDSSGSAYVTGYTASSDFPTANTIYSFGGSKDAFVTKFNSAGSALTYSTYLGGVANEEGHAIAVDLSGIAHFSGITNSANFPTNNPLQSAGGVDDAFVGRVNAGGSALIYSTFLGGSSNDRGYGMTIDAAGNDYVVGETFSTNFPTANAFQSTHGSGGTQDAFVTKVEDKRRRGQVISQ
jgi:hypothetical protein